MFVFNPQATKVTTWNVASKVRKKISPKTFETL
jgi:hypothetical protein